MDIVDDFANQAAVEEETAVAGEVVAVGEEVVAEVAAGLVEVVE